MHSDWARVGIVTPHKLQGYGVSVRLNREISAYQKLSIPVTLLSTVEDGFINDCEVVCISGMMRRVSKVLGFDRIANSETIIRKVFSPKRLQRLSKTLGFKTAQLAQKRKINLLHSDDFVGSIISLSAKNKMQKEPIVVGEFADLIHLDFMERFSLKESDELVVRTKEMLCEVFDELDFAFFVSPLDQEIAIKEFGVNPNKTRVLYEAADIDTPFKNNYGKFPHKVCYLGVLASWENPSLLISSYLYASENIKNLDYTIIGAGPLIDKVRKIAKKNRNIFFYGWKPYADALKIASKSDIGVIASIKKRAMPSKLFVYASLGLPVVSIEGMWWSEFFVKNHDIGYVASPSPKCMGSAIQEALQNPTELEIKGKQARKLIQDEFNWSSRMNKMLKVYDDLSGS
jgi:glycosyltransferase involved in cell wall biosynthesis